MVKVRGGGCVMRMGVGAIIIHNGYPEGGLLWAEEETEEG